MIHASPFVLTELSDQKRFWIQIESFFHTSVNVKILTVLVQIKIANLINYKL